MCSIGLDTEGKLDANVNLTGHLHNLGELDGLLSSRLQVLNREDLEAGVVDLGYY